METSSTSQLKEVWIESARSLPVSEVEMMRKNEGGEGEAGLPYEKVASIAVVPSEKTASTIASSAAPVPATTRPRIAGLDALRGICAIGVVFYHGVHNRNGDYHWTDGFGTQGTLMFFTVSGASLYYSVDASKELDTTKFLLKRYIRLLPLLIFISIWTYAQSRDTTFLEFCRQAVLTWSFAYGFISPKMMGHIAHNAWTLGVEFVCYVFFPIMLKFTRRSTPMKDALVFAFLLLVQGLYLTYDVYPGVHNPRPNRDMFEESSPCFAYFFAGILIGKYTPQLVRLPISLRLTVGFAMFVLSLAMPGGFTDRVTGWKGAFLCCTSIIAVCGFAVEKLIGADVLGRLSYGVYLLHPVIFYHLRDVDSLKGYSEIGVNLAISIPLALILDQFYERPIQKFLRDRVK